MGTGGKSVTIYRGAGWGVIGVAVAADAEVAVAAEVVAGTA